MCAKKLFSFIRSAVEVSSVAFTYYDFQAEKLICSSGLAEKKLGYTKAEFADLTRHFSRGLIHPADRPRVMKSLEALRRAKKNIITEVTARYRRSDGKYLWVYARRVVSERDARGRPAKVTNMFEDVTETVMLQQQLRKKAALIRKISFNNAHELRGPVASMIGLLNLMNDLAFTNDSEREYFQLLKATTQKLDSAIRKINELIQKS